MICIVSPSPGNTSATLHLLPGGAAGDPEVADRGGGHGRRGLLRRMRDIQLPLLDSDPVLSVVINLTDSFTDSFGIVDIMTQGGPHARLS
jgi:hypothetical protein